MENPTFIPRTKPPTKSLRAFKNIVSEKEHGFTLLELVVVILIVGVLATLGFTQYGRMVEKSRGAEARQILGDIRKLGLAYYLENLTTTGITNANVHIGTAEDQIPSACRSSHYFSYYVVDCGTYCLDGYATRCSSGGKLPQGGAANYLRLRTQYTVTNPTDIWTSNAGY
jgi:prepilin-type N-terminal cleavage/methylation domain-containing protein